MEDNTTLAERLVNLQKTHDSIVIERDGLKAKVTELEQTVATQVSDIARLNKIIVDNISFDGKPEPKPSADEFDFKARYKQAIKDNQVKK